MFFGSLLFLLCVSNLLLAESWRKPGCHRMGHTKTISIPDCVEFKITTNACSGYCESWSLPSIMLGFKRHPVTSLGQCCNIMESEDIPVKVLCLDGERNLIFKSAVTCDCYHCQKE
ncbi:thyrostimulin alpha-2 subunit [Maniola jurtina]|uniref:thyrostimulin alpha-2 subunit n=1 Tax=Maniola jurtina TaxID=191418 RepID=UPI001E687642|nr:thyrostimulin alpha-2 subunit [Maniola jurtina]